MSSAISQALHDIKFYIPMEILNRAFIDTSYHSYNNYNIDQAILSSVIRGKVLNDCNLVGGQTMIVDVSKCRVDYYDTGAFVISVPKEQTANRSITSVLSVVNMTQALTQSLSGGGPGMTFSNITSSGQINSNYGTPLMSAMTNLYNVGNNLPIISSAVAEVIGENLVTVRGMPIGVKFGMGIICVVSNDENLSNLQPRSVVAFKALCILACKAYIYNKLIVQIDMGEYKQGASLGVMRSLIDSYSDAAQQYNDYLTQKWTKVAFTNDKLRYNRHIARTTGQRS